MNTLKEETLRDIAYSLDRIIARGNVEYWRLLIPLLPKQLYGYNNVDVEKFAYEGTKERSPSLKLLQEFQRKGMGLSDFKQMLEKIGCQGALDCFKEPGELRLYTKVHYLYMGTMPSVVLTFLFSPGKPIILKHPEAKTVNVNERLELQCIAKCIPEPADYQWFFYLTTAVTAIKGAKNWKLIIEKVTMNHTGYYCCRVQNRRIKDDRYAEFSKYARVTVTDYRYSGLGTVTITIIKVLDFLFYILI